MAQSKNLMAGRHLTAVSLTVMTVGTTGALTIGPTYTLVNNSQFVGWVESVEIDVEREVEDGTVIGSPNANDIPTVTRHTLTLTSPLRYAASGNFLKLAMFNLVVNGDGTVGSPYCKLVLTRGGETFTGYGVLKTYRESYSKGKCAGVLTISMMDTPGASNPTYV